MGAVVAGSFPTVNVLICTMGRASVVEVASVYLAEREIPLRVIVVVDNPSLVRADFVARFPKDERLHFVFNECNLGLTKALNRGLALCTNEIVFRNDDDDQPAPERVRRIVEYLARNPNCDLVYSHAVGKDVQTGRSWVISGPTEHGAIVTRLLKRNFIVHSSIAFKAETVVRAGGYDETFRHAQDYALYLSLIRAGAQFGGISEVLVTRLYAPDSITVAMRTRQIIYSFAARLLHEAAVGGKAGAVRVILRYFKLLLIPNWLRSARRRMGWGR
jgi:glycosyltransferase involved in cell wall biosynthesis